MATPVSADRFLAALKAEGLTVREHPGWKTHNRNSKGAWGPLYGVMVHHTGGGESGSSGILYNGLADLPGPLCQGAIHKDGTVETIGWGRANHAGGGDPDVLAAVKAERYPLPKTGEHQGSSGAVDGNPHFVGYECINKGDGKDPWPPIQLEAIARACAAVCRLYGWSVNSVIRHMDWSDWKPDPKGVDWGKMRARIEAILAGKPNATPMSNWADGDADGSPSQPKPPTTTPSKPDSNAFPGADKFGPGKSNAYVTRLGEMLVKRGGGRFYIEGPGPKWSDADKNATAAFQKAQGWTGADADGIPGPKTWDLLVTGKGKNIPAAAPSKPKPYTPPKFPAGLAPGKSSPSAKPLQRALKAARFMSPSVEESDNYGPRTEAAVARFHNAHTQYRARGKSYDPAIGPKGWDALMRLAYGK